MIAKLLIFGHVTFYPSRAYHNGMRVSLRPYQQQAVENLRTAYRGGNNAPLLVLGTGSGKTVIFCHIAESAAQRGNSILILVHRAELLRQTSEHLDRLGVAHGIIAPGYTTTGSQVQIASVQTLVRRLDRIKINPRLIIVDECHHANAGTWRKIIGHFSRANLLGVTATPCRLDGSGLGVKSGGYFDCMVEGPSVADLIAGGYLAPPVVYAPPVGADLDGLHIRAGDYVAEEMAAALDKPTITGCAIDHYKRICPGVPAIAFCASVEHAEHVSAQFNAAGIPAADLNGKMTDAVRKYRIKALATGGIRVLTSCDIISEGTDIPVVTAAILLRRTMSTGLYLQQVGRVLRPHPGKTNSIILDHVGNTFMHGFPDDVREWDLNAQRQKRGKRDQEPVVQIRQCQTCYAVFKPPVAICPQCGALYAVASRELEQVNGELVKLSREQVVAQKRLARLEQGQAETLDELLFVAKQRGYKPSWAHIVFNNRMAKRAARMEGRVAV